MLILVFYCSLLDQLPKPNYTLLGHLICLLHHIAKLSDHNLMDASNLATCVGPNLLWSNSVSVNESSFVRALTEKLIVNCEELFGDAVTQLLGEECTDSGAEESDSQPSSDTDRLSVDSVDLEEAPRKLESSLSKDSGLALSDSQTFIPEWPELENGLNLSFREEENEILDYPTPNFQRQDWLRAPVKRIRRKSDEEPQQEDVVGMKYLNGRHDAINENVQNCKEQKSDVLHWSVEVSRPIVV